MGDSGGESVVVMEIEGSEESDGASARGGGAGQVGMQEWGRVADSYTSKKAHDGAATRDATRAALRINVRSGIALLGGRKAVQQRVYQCRPK